MPQIVAASLSNRERQGSKIPVIFPDNRELRGGDGFASNRVPRQVFLVRYFIINSVAYEIQFSLSGTANRYRIPLFNLRYKC
jgi:hypothetical protein